MLSSMTLNWSCSFQWNSTKLVLTVFFYAHVEKSVMYFSLSYHGVPKSLSLKYLLLDKETFISYYCQYACHIFL